MDSKPLDQRVREALVARKGDYIVIANATGVSYSWLVKFANGKTDNPGFARLRRLDDYLSEVAKAA